MLVLEKFKVDNYSNLKKKARTIHTSILSIVNRLSIVYYALTNRLEVLELSIEDRMAYQQNRNTNLKDELDYLKNSIDIWTNWKVGRGLNATNVRVLKDDIDADKSVLDALNDRIVEPIQLPEPNVTMQELINSQPAVQDESVIKAVESAIDEVAKAKEAEIKQRQEALTKAQDAADLAKQKQEQTKAQVDAKKAELDRAQQDYNKALQEQRDAANSGTVSTYSEIKDHWNEIASKEPTTLGEKASALIRDVANSLGLDPGNDPVSNKGVVGKLEEWEKGVSLSDVARAKRNKEDLTSALEAAKEYLKEHPGDTAGAKTAADNAIIENAKKRDEENAKRAGSSLRQSEEKLRSEVASDLNLESSHSITNLIDKIKNANKYEEQNQSVYEKTLEGIVADAQTQIDIQNAEANVSGAYDALQEKKKELEALNQQLEDETELANKAAEDLSRVYNEAYSDADDRSFDLAKENDSDTSSGVESTPEPEEDTTSGDKSDSRRERKRERERQREKAEKEYEKELQEKINETGSMDPGDW